MIYDYQTNNRSCSATLYTVKATAHQEKMSFSAPIKQIGNLYLMSGAVKKIENVTTGAASEVTVDGDTYQGYLWRLEPTFDGIYYATVSVTGLQNEPENFATAVIYGNIRQDFIFVPKECLFTDETGQDAVFVVQDGYAMLRRVVTGPLLQGGKKQISHGIFPQETLILSPQNIRTGDRVLPR